MPSTGILDNSSAMSTDWIKLGYKTDEDIGDEVNNIERYGAIDSGGKFAFTYKSFCCRCRGPLLGHRKDVCDKKKFRKLKSSSASDEVDDPYDDAQVEAIIEYLKSLPSVKFGILSMEIKNENKDSKNLEKLLEKIVNGQESRRERTTQLVKPKSPPIWTGQTFDRFKSEVEAWNVNNHESDEGKYIDFIESLKRNKDVRHYVTNVVIEKSANARSVKRVMELLADKYKKVKLKSVWI